MVSPPLFERLSPLLFRPLASQNGHRYWALLAGLFGELWGDGVHAPGELVEKSRIIRVIEQHLIHDDPWVDEEGQEPGSPLPVQANNRYVALRDSGWLAERRRGVRDVATIRPIVAQLYETLSEFAYRGPEFLSSRVQSISANLKLVAEGADGGSFMEAARQAHSLWSHISNTGVQIYELMEALQKAGSTREFVEGYFTRYIQEIYIGDYADIRTSNHPLQHRDEIIRRTLQCVHEEALNERIMHWYTQRLANGDGDRGRRLFDRDCSRLMRMQNIEQPLQRLDEEIRAANQQALMYLEYRTRAPRSIDQLLAKACAAAATVTDSHIGLPEALPVEPMGPEWLANPPRPSLADTGAALQKSIPTIEALAMDALRHRMINARLVNPAKLAAYVARHLDGALQIPSDRLSIESILDFSCYQRLLLIASRNEAPPAAIAQDPYARMVPRIRVAFTDGHTENPYLRHRRFIIHRERHP